MELFKLFGSIMVDNKKANESISKTDSLASKLGKGLGNGVKTAAKWGAGLAAGAAAGGAALFGLTKNAADTGDRVDKLSQKIGLSRQGFQEWDYILSQNGMSIESLQGGMKKMNKMMDDAKSGSKSATEAFSRVGISIDDIKNASPEEAFEMTVKALQEMPDGAEKAALANELLGRSGSELMPLLNGSAESVEELKKQAHEMGIVLSDDAIDATVLFTDTLDNAKRSFGAVVANIGVAVMPMFQSLFDWILSHMPEIQATLEVVFGVIQSLVETAVNIFKTYLLPVLESIVDFVIANWPQISQTMQVVFDGVKVIVDTVASVLKATLLPVFKAIVDWVKQNWPTISQVIKSVFDIAKNVIQIFATVVKGIWNIFGDSILNVTKTVFTTILNVIQGVMATVQGVITVITGLIKGDWKMVWEGIKGITKGVWETIKSIIKGAMDIVKSVIKAGFDIVKNIITTRWNAVKNLTKSVWDAIKNVIQTGVNAIKNLINRGFNAIKNTTNTIWNGVKNVIQNVWNSIRSVVSSGINKIKSVVSGGFNSIKSTATSAWNGVKNAIKRPMDSAANVVRSAINRIKGMFNFRFRWPHLPMPHFSISGSMNPLKWKSQGVPSIGVRWYAKGAIFKKPTIFDTPYGLKGVGEKGPEAVMPIEKLSSIIAEALKTEERQDNNKIVITGNTFTIREDADIDRIARELYRLMETKKRGIGFG